MDAMREQTPIKAIVADDATTICRFVERALMMTGREFDITTVHDGHEAVEQLSKHAFDLAFLDINMPQLSGIEVMAAIQVTGSKTFAVSMSDSLEPEAEAKLKQFGAYDFLVKPFNNAQVRQIVETYEAIHTDYDVLVVDDSATVRRIVEKVLKKSIFSLRIAQAGDGASAIEMVKAKNYRIVFTDFNMPNMTGIQLAEKLAAHTRASDVILMSTEINDALDKAAQSVGAKAFLRKPFYPQDVDSILHHLFGLRHSRFSKQVRTFAMT
ncbi:PleD family two-component response regulator [Roseibium hamelinense]|uniref:PleD family two-component response regulator n=1 Tax=Roseibium hamelinense TaxID=150831 RepID=A0A562SMG2_9HYPH|nr:response regulator [Roseibium hamelinense]MTI43234.1 response regulator [Roseibium hamelinense]TWI81840.1 PleD family two-component response regulator [Roseibium hamelinense]